MQVRQALTRVTCGGAPVYVWPGGGITILADVLRLPDNAFGYVPTPALDGPIEFTMRLADYRTLGGHVDKVRELASVEGGAVQVTDWHADNPWPFDRMDAGGKQTDA